MKDVIVYATDYCPYCRQAERFLTEQGVPFRVIDVTEDDVLRAKVVELSGGRMTVPQIFIGDEPIGGFSDLIQLHRQGTLKGKLEAP